MSDALVRAIQQDWKSQTRRLPPRGLTITRAQDGVYDFTLNGEWVGAANRDGVPGETTGKFLHYRKGDVLYVREAWRPRRSGPDAVVEYGADGARAAWPERIGDEFDRVFKVDRGNDAQPWRPPRFMFRALARHWLEVTGVRVEPLQEITEADATAEGSWVRRLEECAKQGWAFDPVSPGPVALFREAWDGIHGEGAWAENPIVQVVTFRRFPGSKRCTLCGEPTPCAGCEP